MEKRFLFLGTGHSAGVPMLGCDCPICKSPDPKNKRLRSSGILKIRDLHILIDASPDIRQAGLMYGVDQIDGVLLTHFHEDHVGGLNDLRGFFRFKKQVLPLILSPETHNVISVRFSYLMDRFDVSLLKERRGSFSFKGIQIGFFTYSHIGVQVTGWRFDDFAYVTDIKDYEDSIFEDLRGVNTLVLSAIHEADSTMHFSLEEALKFIEKVRPKWAYLTHISHEMDHETIAKRLPKGVELAYDGMEIDV